MSSIRRIAYLDALKGFVIFLVVYYHINLFMGRGGKCLFDSIWDTALITFMMPLFFFVSGYVSHKIVEWSPKLYVKLVLKKAQTLLVPTVIFSIIYSIAFYPSVQIGVAQYWFTIVLFEYFLIFFTIDSVFGKYETLKFCSLIVLACLGAILFSLRIGPGWSCYVPLCLGDSFQYFQFFTLGILARRYDAITKRVLNSSFFNSASILIFVISLILMGFTNVMEPVVLKVLIRTFVVRYAGLFIVFSLFYRYKNYFEGNGKINNALQYVGRHTLDIYMLHFFFIDSSATLSAKIHNFGSLPLEVLFIGILALVNIALCLLLSQCIRNSSFFAKYIFGAKG